MHLGGGVLAHHQLPNAPDQGVEGHKRHGKLAQPRTSPRSQVSRPSISDGFEQIWRKTALRRTGLLLDNIRFV
jgi:hypothetical protein